jgi:hypothetical protein
MGRLASDEVPSNNCAVNQTGFTRGAQLALTKIPADSWLGRMLARKPRMLVAIALANKMARQLWAMLTKNADYRDPALAAAA